MLHCPITKVTNQQSQCRDFANPTTPVTLSAIAPRLSTVDWTLTLMGCKVFTAQYPLHMSTRVDGIPYRRDVCPQPQHPNSMPRISRSRISIAESMSCAPGASASPSRHYLPTSLFKRAAADVAGGSGQDSTASSTSSRNDVLLCTVVPPSTTRTPGELALTCATILASS
jgi:hypothetical protein